MSVAFFYYICISFSKGGIRTENRLAGRGIGFFDDKQLSLYTIFLMYI